MGVPKSLDYFKNKLSTIYGDEYSVVGTYVNMKTKVLIRHNKCGIEWKTVPQNLVHGRNCPFCSKKCVSDKYNLFVINPLLCNDWNYSKNKLLPNQYLPKSNKVVWWKCHLGHEWKSSIINRQKGNGCPYCSKKCATKDYNLMNNYPDVCSEWNYDKNKQQPSQYTPHSSKKVWWICSYGHEWEAVIANRTGGDRGCPYCAHQSIGEDNNLMFLYPDVCEEWDYNKNSESPYNLAPFSHDKYWWKCNRCGKSWEATTWNRINRKSGCPYCYESKAESFINKFLSNHCIPFTSQYSFSDLKGKFTYLRFDFAVFEDKEKSKIKLLIEYDGEFHYKKFYDGQHFETQQYYDKLKTDYCKSHHIKLIRIPYWERESIELILEKILNIKADDM